MRRRTDKDKEGALRPGGSPREGAACEASQRRGQERLAYLVLAIDETGRARELSEQPHV